MGHVGHVGHGGGVLGVGHGRRNKRGGHVGKVMAGQGRGEEHLGHVGQVDGAAVGGHVWGTGTGQDTGGQRT